MAIQMKKLDKVGFLIKIPNMIGTKGSYLNLPQTMNYNWQHHIIKWKIKATVIKIRAKAGLGTFTTIQHFLKILSNVLGLLHKFNKWYKYWKRGYIFGSSMTI